MSLQRSDWIESAGGPLLLAPRSSLPDWLGACLDADADVTDDYARACAIDGEIGTLLIRGRCAVVLGDMPDATALLQRGAAGEVYVLRWRWAPSEEVLLSEVLADGALQSLPFVSNGWLEAAAEDCWLFDSAVAGSEVDDYRKATLQAGRYVIESALFSPRRELCVLVHRLRGEGRGAEPGKSSGLR